MALNPECTPGEVAPDPANPATHAALCGCGWGEGGFPSRSAAKAAQRDHRFPPGGKPHELEVGSAPPAPATELTFIRPAS